MLAVLIALVLTVPQSKTPVPDAAAQKTAEKLIRDVFKDDFAKKAPADKSALARKLLSQSKESGDDPAQRFVLLREARDLARDAADWETAQLAIDETGNVFQADVATMKVALYAAMGSAAKKPEDWLAVARKQLALAEEAAALDQLDVAAKAASEASSLAKKAKDLALAAKADTKVKDLGDRRTWQAKVQKAAETLTKSPDDAEANSVVGRQEGPMKGDWGNGLLHLAKGSDAALKAAAMKDLARPEGAAAQVAAGDAWWDLADKDASTRLSLRLRATFWYGQAAESATGLLKSKIDARMAEARFDRFPGTWVDKTDPRPYGIIAKEGDPIAINPGSGNSIRASLDKPLTGDWDALSARIRFGKERSGAAAIWFEDFNCGIAVLINFQTATFAYKSETGKLVQDPKVPIVSKDDYVVIVVLSEGNYIYYLDGKEIARHPTKATKLTNLAFDVEETTVTFDQIRLRKK